jgi:hypothetical protein
MLFSPITSKTLAAQSMQHLLEPKELQNLHLTDYPFEAAASTTQS